MPRHDMTIRAVWLVALGLAAPLANAAPPLGLADVWRAAAQHDPEFAAARAAHDAGGSRRAQADALWRPNVVLEGGVGLASNETATRGAAFSAPGATPANGVAFDTSINNGTSSRVALSLRQPIFSRERAVQSGQLQTSADVADLQWQAAQQDLILRSADRYFDVALAEEQLRLLAGQQVAVDHTLVEARDRFRIGDEPITASHEAAARSAGLKAQVLSAETELELKRVALADLSGLAVDDAPLLLPRRDPNFDDLGALPGWLAQADRDSPTLRLSEAQLRMAELEARKTSAAVSPTLDLVAEVGRERLAGSGDFGSASNTTNSRAVGVRLVVPLYTGGWRSAQQREAQALVDKAHGELEHVRQQVALQTRSAWLDIAVGSSRIAALQAAALASRARLDSTRVGLQAGDRTTLDLLNAENDAAAADLALVQARVHVLTSRLRLAAVTGQLDEGSLARIGTAVQAAP